MYDIAVTTVTVLYNPAYSVEMAMYYSNSPSRDGNNNAMIDAQGFDSSPSILLLGQTLGNKFLKLFRMLRGGNHPYLEKYMAHIKLVRNRQTRA